MPHRYVGVFITKRSPRRVDKVGITAYAHELPVLIGDLQRAISLTDNLVALLERMCYNMSMKLGCPWLYSRNF